MEGANRPLEGIERVKHAWPAGCWLDSTVLRSLVFRFSAGSAEYSFGRQQLISLLLLVPL